MTAAVRFASERSFKGWRCSGTMSPWSPDSFCPLARWLPMVFNHHALPQALTLILSHTPPSPPHRCPCYLTPLFLLRCCFYVLEEVMAICLSSVFILFPDSFHSSLTHSLIHFYFFFCYLCVILLTVGFRNAFCMSI